MVGNRKNLRLRSWWSALVPLKSVCGYFTGSWVPALTQERSWEMKLCFLSFPPARMCNLIISTQTRSTSRRLSCLPPQLGDAVRSCIGLQRRLPHEWLWGDLGAWHIRPCLAQFVQRYLLPSETVGHSRPLHKSLAQGPSAPEKPCTLCFKTTLLSHRTLSTNTSREHCFSLKTHNGDRRANSFPSYTLEALWAPYTELSV